MSVPLFSSLFQEDERLTFCFLSNSYCTRVKLDKVPEGDWMCEECMLGVQMDIQNEAPKTARTLKDSFMNRIVEISTNASAFRFKSGIKLNVKGSDVEEIQTKKENSSSLLSAKKHARNSEAGLVTKRTLETSVKSSRASRTFSKSLLHGKSSSKNSGKTKSSQPIKLLL